MLLPQELKNHKFHRAVSGYATAEVEEYIDFIVSKYETLYRENDELERKLSIAIKSLDELRAREKQVAELETVLKATIAKASADAEAKRTEIIRDAVAEADRVTAEAEAYVAAQEKVLRQVQSEVAALRNTLFAAYSEHIDRIEQLTAIAAGDLRPNAADEADEPADLEEIGEEILPEEDEIPEDTEIVENGEAIEDGEAITDTEVVEDYEQIEFTEADSAYASPADTDEDVYTEDELTEEESTVGTADEELPFRVSEEDTYTEDELFDEDDPFAAPDTDDSTLDVLFEEFTDDLPSPEEPASDTDDEDAILLKELHNVFVHNIDARQKEKEKKQDESAVDDILKALAEAIEEPAADLSSEDN